MEAIRIMIQIRTIMEPCVIRISIGLKVVGAVKKKGNPQLKKGKPNKTDKEPWTGYSPARPEI